MPTHTIQLDQNDLKQIRQIESSTIHYSIQLAKIVVEEHKIKTTIIGLEEARYKLVESLLKSNGFEIAKVTGVDIGESGEVKIQINESETKTTE